MKKHSLQEVKEKNKEYILDLILNFPGLSRLELAQMSGLSGGTVTALVLELINEKKLKETSKRESTGGRPKIELEICMLDGEIIIFEIKQRSLVFKSYDRNNQLLDVQTFKSNYLNGNTIVETITTIVKKQEQKPKHIGVLIEENIQDSEIRYMLSTSISQDSISLDVALKMYLDVDVTVERTLKYLLSEELIKLKLDKIHLYAYVSVDENLYTNIFNNGEIVNFNSNKILDFNLAGVFSTKGLHEQWGTISNHNAMDLLIGNQSINSKSKLKTSAYRRFVKLLAEAMETMLLFYPLDAIFLVGKASLFPTLDTDITRYLQQSTTAKDIKLIQTIVPSYVDVAKNMNRFLVKNQLLGGNKNVG